MTDLGNIGTAAAAIIDTVESLGSGRARTLRSLTVTAPAQPTGVRIGEALERRLRARGLEHVRVDVVIEPGPCRLVAAEFGPE